MLIPMQIKNPLTHPIIILAHFVHAFGEIIALILCCGRRTHPSPYCCYDKRWDMDPSCEYILHSGKWVFTITKMAWTVGGSRLSFLSYVTEL